MPPVKPQPASDPYASLPDTSDPYASLPNTYRPPDQLRTGPGFLKRQWLDLQNKWRQANAPIFESANPQPGTLTEQYMKERQRLQEIESGTGSEEYNKAWYANRIEHPVISGIRATLAGIENRAADLLTPAFAATAVVGPVSRGFQEAVPEVAGAMRVAGPAAKWGTAGAYATQGAGNVYEGAKTGNLSEILGGGLAMLPLATEGFTAAGEKAVSGVRPKVVKIAGVDIPLLSGEADPGSFGAISQEGMKTGGIGARRFIQFAEKQQAAVKQVIRKVAQQTSGMIGPVSEEPGAAMQDAANASFAKARPMYQALDASLTTIPKGFQKVSALTKTAIARAKALGVDVEAESPYAADIKAIIKSQGYGVPYEQLTAAKQVEVDAIAKTSGFSKTDMAAQPLTTFIKVKSELLKMARGSSDEAKKYAIQTEVKAMNEAMEKAMEGTPAYANYMEASRLWAKGYALEDVADALRKTTAGTPAGVQHPGLAQVPTDVKGPNLVGRLNDLYNEGTMSRAFSFDEANHLRQAADILDRASVKVGKFGVPIHGYGSHSTWYDAAKRLGMRPFVNAMTTVKGVEGVKALTEATTKEGYERAFNMIAAAATQISTPRSLKELREEANKRKAPAAPPPGPQSSAMPYTHIFDEERGMIVPA